MISYEVSIGFIIVGVLISTGSLNLSRIVEAQDGSWGLFSWYWLPHFPMVVLFFITRWPRPTGRRSTCPRRRASWWRATRWNIPRRRSCSS